MLRWAERNSQSRTPASANQPPQPALGEPGVLLGILTQRAPHIGPDVEHTLCRALPAAADPGSRSVAAQCRSDTGVLQPAQRSSIMHGDEAIPQRLPVNGLLCRAEKDKKTKKAEAEGGGDVHAQFA